MIQDFCISLSLDVLETEVAAPIMALEFLRTLLKEPVLERKLLRINPPPGKKTKHKKPNTTPKSTTAPNDTSSLDLFQSSIWEENLRVISEGMCVKCFPGSHGHTKRVQGAGLASAPHRHPSRLPASGCFCLFTSGMCFKEFLEGQALQPKAPPKWNHLNPFSKGPRKCFLSVQQVELVSLGMIQDPNDSNILIKIVSDGHRFALYRYRGLLQGPWDRIMLTYSFPPKSLDSHHEDLSKGGTCALVSQRGGAVSMVCFLSTTMERQRVFTQFHGG